MKPLEGKTVLVTRPSHQADGLGKPLAELGATIYLMPAIEIQPLEDTSEIEQALRSLSDFDWVVFTSVNGVESVRVLIDRFKIEPRNLSSRKLAVIGPATAKALSEAVRDPDLMPETFVSERIADALGDVKGLRFLLLRADLARRDLADILRERGAMVTEVAAYHIVRSTSDANLPEKSPDYITLTSSAAAANTIEILRDRGHADWVGSSNLACIGPITEKTVRNMGFEPAVVAEEYTVPGIVEAIRRHAEAHP